MFPGRQRPGITKQTTVAMTTTRAPFKKKFIENPVYSLTHSRTNNIRQHFVCNLVLDQHRAATRPSAPFKEEIESRPTQDE